MKPILLIAFLVCAITGCNHGSARVMATSGAENKEPQPIRYGTAEIRSVEDAIDVPAKVQADPATVVHVYSPLSGRVLNIALRPGDRVRRGQTVAQVQSSDVASARADYAKAKIDANRTQTAERRSEMLYQHEVIAAKDYEEAKAAAAAAQAELARVSERLQILGTGANSASDILDLRAPRSGVVLDIAGAPGELSKSLDNANSLATIADLEHVWVLGDIFEKDFAYAKAGNPVQIRFDAYPNVVWRGKIDMVAATIDPQTRTTRIRVVLPNEDHRLKPEMFGTMHLSRGQRQQLVVAAEAVLRDGDRAYVFVHQGDKNLKRDVTLGHPVGQAQMEILTGLKAGEQVVVSGAELLRQEGGQ